MEKPSHISIQDEPLVFFEDADRFLITPEVFTFLREDDNEMTFDMTHELWLDQLWDCIDDIIRMFGWRGISTEPIHISRCFNKVQGADDADMLDARSVLRRDEPTDAEFYARKEEQISFESSLFVNKKDQFINDELWCVAVANSFSRLLATLATNKIAMNVFAFLELLGIKNKAEGHSDERKMYLELAGFEIYSRTSIAVLRGEEIW